MEELDFSRFEQAAAEFDGHVRATLGIDHYCSSTDWVLPAATALMPPRAPWLLRGEHGSVALMRAQHADGYSYVEPLEAMWGLACPVVGCDAAAVSREFAAACARARAEGIRDQLLILCGIMLGSPLFRGLTSSLSRSYSLRLGPITRRCVASLAGGFDGFLGRRSASLRQNVRKAERRAADLGVSFETLAVGTAPASAEAAYERLLAVETRSWKGHSGTGLGQREMQGFYRHMVPRLAARGALRLMFARHEGRDVGYILGGVLGTSYRGLQFSVDDEPIYQRISLGNLAQVHQIAALADEGMTDYDLGTDGEYKRRWGEGSFETVTLVAQLG